MGARFFNTHGVQHHVRSLATPLTLALAVHFALRSHGVAARLGDDLARYGGGSKYVLPACGASVVLCALVLGWSLGGGREHATRSPRYLVSGLCLLVLWVAVYQALGQPYSPVTAAITLGLACGAHALVVGIGGLVRWRVPAVVPKAAVAVCATLVAGEFALVGLAAFDPRPIFATGSASERAFVESYRFEPGSTRFGTPTNALGHYDQPFLPPESRTRPMVAVVGDSFVAGTVPLADLFHTVAERELGDVDVYAFGVSAVGVPEYRYLIEREVLPLRPDAVVVSFYAGNDLLGLLREPRADRYYARWLDREQLLLRAVPERLLALRAVRKAGGLQGAEPV
ncbi:MAG TPA: SGNH/GDSL hydrolase family protein, partial [Planctomycetota bacterium]|nr:SGNH/GDSL hydrolase family protein [Planctomycetota bacterium]